jgi:hypothetical protein
LQTPQLAGHCPICPPLGSGSRSGSGKFASGLRAGCAVQVSIEAVCSNPRPAGALVCGATSAYPCGGKWNKSKPARRRFLVWAIGHLEG